MKKIIVLGASGTIGQNTIDIIRNFPDLFSLAGVTVHSNRGMLEQEQNGVTAPKAEPRK